MNHLRMAGVALVSLGLLMVMALALKAPAGTQPMGFWLCALIGVVSTLWVGIVLKTEWRRTTLMIAGIASLFVMPQVWSMFGLLDLVGPLGQRALYTAFAWFGAIFALVIATQNALKLAKNSKPSA